MSKKVLVLLGVSTVAAIGGLVAYKHFSKCGSVELPDDDFFDDEEEDDDEDAEEISEACDDDSESFFETPVEETETLEDIMKDAKEFEASEEFKNITNEEKEMVTETSNECVVSKEDKEAE